MRRLTLDTETTGLHYMKEKAFSCGLKSEDSMPYYVDIRQDGLDRIVQEIKDHDLLIGHNIKFDLHMLVQAGVPWYIIKDKKIYDTMIAEAILNEHRKSYSLDALGENYFGLGKIDIVSQINGHFNTKMSKSKAMGKIKHMPRKWVEEYCLRDVEITEKIYKVQRDRIKNFSIFDLEMRVLPHLIEIERRGVPVNEEGLFLAQREYDKKIRSLQKKLKVNVSSPLEMKAKFLELGIPLVINPETGNPTFSKVALRDNGHPFIQDVLKLREYRKLKEGFLSKMGEHVVAGKLHTNFHQTKSDEYGTISGRLSSSGPNMQQVPKRKGDAFKVMRSLYHAPEGKSWLCGDWSQFEFRMFAHYSQDMKLYDAYKEDPDIDYHQLVADMAGITRRTAKTINLGLSFGMGENRLAKELGLSIEDAQQLFEKYHERFPKIKEFLKVASSIGAKRGYVKTLLGRRIRFPDKRQSYKAGALIFQGSAADVMKKKIIQLNSALQGLVLIVHDEFNFIVDNVHRDKQIKIFKELMEDVPELNVPVRASINFGSNWWEAS